MPYNLLPTPKNARVGDYDLYQIELPADENWRAILIGALTFSADDESYQRRGKLPVDDLGIPAVAAYCISTLEKAMKDPLGTLKFCTFANDADAPDSWAKCDGRIINSSDYPGIENIPVLIDFGAGAYQTPNYEGHNVRVATSSQPAGQKIGSDTHTLTVAEMPAHRHTYRLRTIGSIPVEPGPPVFVSNTGLQDRTTLSVGGDQPHNNIPRSFVTDVWIVVK